MRAEQPAVCIVSVAANPASPASDARRALAGSATSSSEAGPGAGRPTAGAGCMVLHRVTTHPNSNATPG